MTTHSTTKYLWIPALCLTVLLLLFLMAAFFMVPTLTADRRHTVLLFSALVGALSAMFWGGTITASADIPHGTGGKIFVSLTGGAVVFYYLYAHQPYWYNDVVKKCEAAAPSIGGLIGSCHGDCEVSNSSASMTVTINGKEYKNYDRKEWIDACVRGIEP